eukprot:TRINITY_DN15757_c0_g1_i1.p1 TRINITY_DN15757_c0_g1~~TRINITY_DN15757_c0_g1_i1.p1  ORF type:complete len:410 (-),score=23.71 TRINITY_DN15757_c0_g1_i1:1055-2284(-)
MALAVETTRLCIVSPTLRNSQWDTSLAKACRRSTGAVVGPAARQSHGDYRHPMPGHLAVGQTKQNMADRSIARSFHPICSESAVLSKRTTCGCRCVGQGHSARTASADSQNRCRLRRDLPSISGSQLFGGPSARSGSPSASVSHESERGEGCVEALSHDGAGDGTSGGNFTGHGGGKSGRGRSGGDEEGASGLPEGEGEGEGLGARYSMWAEKYPYVTKGVTAALLNAMADLICQLFVEKTGTIDVKRLLNFASMGLFIVGPSLHIWYGLLLPRMITLKGSQGTIGRLLLDQVLFAPGSIVVFLAIVMGLEGRPLTELQPKLEQVLLPTIFAQWKLWIPVQFVNFRFVPPHLQAATVSTVGLIWTVYMSLVSHQELTPSPPSLDSPMEMVAGESAASSPLPPAGVGAQP